jgi:hypothetical protein
MYHVGLLIAEQKQLQKHNMHLKSTNAPFPKGMQTWFYKLKQGFVKASKTKTKFGKHV